MRANGVKRLDMIAVQCPEDVPGPIAPFLNSDHFYLLLLLWWVFILFRTSLDRPPLIEFSSRNFARGVDSESMTLLVLLLCMWTYARAQGNTCGRRPLNPAVPPFWRLSAFQAPPTACTSPAASNTTIIPTATSYCYY